MANTSIKTIIFDMDGTLYELDGGSFSSSQLAVEVKQNALAFIANKLSLKAEEAQSVLEQVQTEFGENISVGLEVKFGISRFEYFNNVWNIKAEGIVAKSKPLAPTLAALGQKYRLVLVSDSPRIWIDNVLQYLNLADIFSIIYSGEGDRKKISNNYFEHVLDELAEKPDDCCVVGDQEHTDILPAKKLGMKAIYVSQNSVSDQADHSIKNIEEIFSILKQEE